ncbi:tRNA adenosine(34) deaminase TadA [Bombilactobacillus thymidiniphilus]|uniref:tRNA-specific adenosine deaminase n=1 Tax=Bombilactobacillus thymidiniphilus TaxID=2923363 RepID=A0ABY4PDY4_9LACO|nr:tRNA adenosine(34) deaminase TadA [Bombilactobacillus thymidiniphilus]UQS83936.1 tRNA adenosine(34) deaminase TadA [Bombilactobacillus thymidiniphilus]
MIEELYSSTELEFFMQEAIKVAHKAQALAEVPIGAVIVDDQTKKIIATGYNRREMQQNSLAHAELIAIEQACQQLGSWRLENCSIFVTLEPCAMCAGAIINSRLRNVVFGAFDPKAGSLGSLVNLFTLPYNHHPNLYSGILERQCANLLTNFFREIRRRQRERK